jgi:hypothetical protein
MKRPSDTPQTSYARKRLDIFSTEEEVTSLLEHIKNICLSLLAVDDEASAMTPTRIQLKMALNGLGWARLDEQFRRAFGQQSLERAMSGLAVKPGIFALMIELLEARGVEFREDGSVKVPEDT